MDEGPDFLDALKLVRRRKMKVKKAKALSEEIHTLNIVAMMDMMTILLVFLLKGVSFSAASVSSSANLTLPISSATVDTIECVKVFIGKQYIIVEDEKVAEIKDGRVVPSYLAPDNNLIIPNLKVALSKQVDRQLRLQRRMAGLKQFEFQGNLSVLADTQTWYEAILQVTSTAGQSGSKEDPSMDISFNKIRLTVKKNSEGI